MREYEHHFTFIGKPMTKDNSKTRGRHGRYYLDPKLKKYETDLQFQFNAQIQPGFKIYSGPTSVHLRFFFPDRRRRDVWNYSKSIGDALNGFAWTDDSIIERVVFVKKIDRLNPRIELYIGGM